MDAKQLVMYHTACTVQSTITTGQPEALLSTIGRPSNMHHDHATRNAGRITLPRIRTETGKRRLCYRGVTIINELGLDPGITNFKRHLKSVIMSQPP